MGWPKAVPLEKLQEKGFLENNKFIFNVQVKVAQVVDEGSVTGNEMLDVNGFQVLYSQVYMVTTMMHAFRRIGRSLVNIIASFRWLQ